MFAIINEDVPGNMCWNRPSKTFKVVSPANRFFTHCGISLSLSGICFASERFWWSLCKDLAVRNDQVRQSFLYPIKTWCFFHNAPNFIYFWQNVSKIKIRIYSLLLIPNWCKLQVNILEHNTLFMAPKFVIFSSLSTWTLASLCPLWHPLLPPG